MDILLDTTTHDIKLTMVNGLLELTLTDGPAAVEQDWKIRMWTFKGEWFADQRIGVPYFQNILVKNPDLTLIGSIFRRVALSTTGIAAVLDLTMGFERVSRNLTVAIEVRLEDGIAGPDETFRFTFDELILPSYGVDE